MTKEKEYSSDNLQDRWSLLTDVAASCEALESKLQSLQERIEKLEERIDESVIAVGASGCWVEVFERLDSIDARLARTEEKAATNYHNAESNKRCIGITEAQIQSLQKRIDSLEFAHPEGSHPGTHARLKEFNHRLSRLESKPNNKADEHPKPQEDRAEVVRRARDVARNLRLTGILGTEAANKVNAVCDIAEESIKGGE